MSFLKRFDISSGANIAKAGGGRRGGWCAAEARTRAVNSAGFGGKTDQGLIATSAREGAELDAWNLCNSYRRTQGYVDTEGGGWGNNKSNQPTEKKGTGPNANHMQ